MDNANKAQVFERLHLDNAINRTEHVPHHHSQFFASNHANVCNESNNIYDCYKYIQGILKILKRMVCLENTNRQLVAENEALKQQLNRVLIEKQFILQEMEQYHYVLNKLNNVEQAYLESEDTNIKLRLRLDRIESEVKHLAAYRRLQRQENTTNNANTESTEATLGSNDKPIKKRKWYHTILKCSSDNPIS